MELIAPQNGKVQILGVSQLKVTTAMCVHREVKVKTFQVMRMLEKCPDPKFEFTILEGDALIDRSRSRMATHWLKNQSDVDYILFLDDDIVYDPRDLRKMMMAMKYYDLDILGAAYATKTDSGGTFAIRTMTGNEMISFGQEGEIHEVRYLSTGCMAIHRRVFQKMIDKESVHFCHPGTKEFYPFFKPMEHKGEDGRWLYLSEDWAFCQRASELGFKVFCDTTIKLDHIGNYTYNWDNFLTPPKQVWDSMKYEVKEAKD